MPSKSGRKALFSVISLSSPKAVYIGVADLFLLVFRAFGCSYLHFREPNAVTFCGWQR